MLVVHAGNRVDAEGRAEPRFPSGNVDDVRARVRRLLSALRPDGVVSAPAAGADLIVLEEAAALDIPIHVVLPIDVDAFEAASVADLGDDWVERYRTIVARAGRRPHSLIDLGHDPDSDWYRHANGALIDRALALAGTQRAVAALTIRPRPGAGDPSVTDDFAERAEAAGLVVLTLDPRSRREDRRTAEVVVASAPSNGEGDLDRAFDMLLVPALEDADLEWWRRELTAGAAGAADVVVIAQLTRHPVPLRTMGSAVGADGALFVAPDGAPAPERAPGLRHVNYPLHGAVPTDDEAIEGWRRLARALAAG